jgi:hypothetical protein
VNVTGGGLLSPVAENEIDQKREFIPKKGENDYV